MRLTGDQGLDVDTSHDLLARLIFIQFLFQRKDSQGRAALNEDVLANLHEQKILKARAHTLEEILTSHADTYRLFQWLDSRFNGDLFPAEEQGAPRNRSKWSREMSTVKSEHLQLLSDFVAGTLQMKTAQMSLWPQYSFDALPLEFISSIYESFLDSDSRRSGGVYTPARLVDFLLDEVLPWRSNDWNIRVLDPACGSGIFLVKAFQRLIYRWRNANPGIEPKAEILKRLLEKNLLGVDIQEHAVRTAVFSLYLALCDEIDPKYYWQTVRFPRLRGKRLIARDFFSLQTNDLFDDDNITPFDLVVGNAPWGKNTLTPPAKAWATANGWATPYGQIGPLFLPKAAQLTKNGGRLCMLQPAGLIFFPLHADRCFPLVKP
jgi:methylase of polypeptide subunit release factors